ncbi:MAG: endonuclease/exonuclease/phosphatase family protein, partial [Anaerolineae bacterium]|nr:endonuclease/exonuclease/phosphatase family protein [Anaerolineae bacterium]
MPFYYPLKWKGFGAAQRKRTAAKLLDLRQQIRDEIPTRTVRDTLLLATWNIRDFDSNKFGHGPRLDEAYYYIAEIISAFDLVALQEVNEDLDALERVMRILGHSWDFIATDVTAGSSGNNERMTFVYDKRKISFQNIAGEIVLPLKQLVEDEKQFARTPFLVSFQSGWFKFNLCTVHIYYGASSGAQLKRRIAEIEKIAKFLSTRADKDENSYILLGDFNIVSPEHKTMEALVKQGFFVPDDLGPTNIHETMYYDQIAFKTQEGRVQFGDSAGVFDFNKSVFKN